MLHSLEHIDITSIARASLTGVKISLSPVIVIVTCRNLSWLSGQPQQLQQQQQQQSGSSTCGDGTRISRSS